VTVILLGPQRFRPSVRNTVRSLGTDGRVATITAGWQEREADDAELDGLLDGRSVNLGLYQRLVDITERDPEFADAELRREEVLEELRSVYVLRVDHAVQALYELLARDFRATVTLAALDDAIEALRALDRRHVELLGEVQAEFYDTYKPHERPVVAEHRAAVERILAGSAALAIAGGHVGVLLDCIHLLNVGAALPDIPVLGWSAGAMALTERVVLFNDRAPDSRPYAEVFDPGLSLCRGVVALPHARRRLRLEDPIRVMVMARRFAPARCVVLDDGVRMDCGTDEHPCPPGTRVLTTDGRVEALEAVAV
jgi:hypothetical protein